MNIISSKDNEFVKSIKKLKDKKNRDINNEYIIEGIKLIDEAIKEIEGFEELTIDENTGIYTVKIDGQIYTVIKHEGGKSEEENSNEIIEIEK